MLWKPGSASNGGGSDSRPSSNGSNHLKRRSQEGQIRIGVIIYPFQDYGKSKPSSNAIFLDLDLGDSVVIAKEVAQGWYYGWKKWNHSDGGLFPVSHVVETNYEFGPFLDKIGEVCREWGEIRKKLYVEVHPYQFEHIGRGIHELIEGRRSILNQSLTQDQYREVTRKLCSRIDWGNRKLGLDLVPWAWLLEDSEERPVSGISTSGESTSSRSSENSLKVIPECNRDAGKLFKLHQKSVESAASRGNSTLSRPKNKTEIRNNLYVSMRDFNYSLTDDCEISFSLFDGKRFVSERRTMTHTQLPQSNFHMGEDRPTLFCEVMDKRDLYLVVTIVRIGRMFYAENANKKLPKRRFRRPYACGVLSLNDVEYLNDDEFEFNSGFREKSIKLYTADEKDFWLVHELLISNNHKNINSKVIPVLNSFIVSVFWCGLNICKNGSTNIAKTRLIGMNNLIAPPGVVRNDLYLTLNSVDLVEKKQNKTGGAKNCNLEVEIQVIDDDDELLPLDGNCYKSIILHHVNFPKFYETVKFVIPIEVFPRAKVRLLFRHCSTKDKNEKKMFGVTWLNLMAVSGTTLKDGEHQIHICKWTDEQSLPTQSTNLSLLKDVVNLESLMISTKFTQNIDLVNLLRWKQNTKDLKASLMNLIASQEATEEIVRKFLQDVLDALFTIFSGDDGNSTEYSGEVFTLLVNIFQLLRNSKYAAYKSVLNAYCVEHFAATLVYKGLLLSLKHYTNVLLNSVAKDITQLIQNSYNSLEFIFKFVVQSQILFSKATGGKLDDSFRRDVKSLVDSFCKVFKCTDSNPVFVETQSIILHNLHSVYEELLRVMSIQDVCELVCEIFKAIPIKETAGHPLSPAKLSAIHQIVKSSLFRDSSCRAKLLPVMCKHIRHHLAHREELKLCTDVLSEILIFLHDTRAKKEESSNAHADIETVCTTTLEMLVQSVLVLERTSSIVGNLVTCLISLLEQMDSCHYNRLCDEFHERKPLRDLLLRVFLLFRDLIKHEVFPADWAYMKLLTNHVMLKSLQEFCQPLVTYFLKYFDVQLWTQYFTLAVTFVSQPGLQLEYFRESKREWIMEKYGDMRLIMGQQMLQLWGHLKDPEIRSFIPTLIGPFLEVSMIPEPKLRSLTLHTFFYDMMKTEFRLNGDIKETESELIDKLDLLINSHEEIQHGDESYRKMFREIHLKRLETEEIKQGQQNKLGNNNNNWHSMYTESIESLSNLQQLLLDYREIANCAINAEESRDKLMQCTVNLLNFYKEEKRFEQYLRYVYKLHDLHLCAENWAEAGFTLLLHGQHLRWDWEKVLPECYEPGLQYPRHKEAERKEFIFLRVLGYFDQGKVWEKGITLCKELADQYEKKYDYNKLSRILQTQAKFYDNILNVHRPEPEYFRVGFFGQGFPLFVRNKEFIYRGQEYERLAAFIQRILAEWPNATLLQKNSPPEQKIVTDPGQFLQICNVRPKPGPQGNPNIMGIPEKIRSFYYVNDVSTFQYDRRIEKLVNGEVKPQDENNEFKTMWIERTILQTAVEFPGQLRMLEISSKKTREISPIEFACEKMEEANVQLQTLISQYASIDDGMEMRNVNPLSMRLQGMLDAAVMGGIPKYTEAFFNEEYLKKEETNNFALKLVGNLQEQVKLLEEGLEIHGKLVPPGVQPLHKRLLECHTQMKSSVQETEIFVYSTVASLNNATLRRSESGNTVIVRDSFRKLGSGKSIVNSPLPPVPKFCPGKRETDKVNSASNSNRSSMSSGGYGQVTFNSGNRENFYEDDDDVYSQPVSVEDQNNLQGANGNSLVKPPLIPSRLKKTLSSTSDVQSSNNEYIIMPPSRLRVVESNGANGNGPPPVIPPKPGSNNNAPAVNGGTSSSDPPPLLPRKPSLHTGAPSPTPPPGSAEGETSSLGLPGSPSKASSNASLNSETKPSTPPPVPPKPKANNGVVQNTYMNKAELLASMNQEEEGRNKRNSDPIGYGLDSPGRKSGHKEFYVPPKKDPAPQPTLLNSPKLTNSSDC